MLSVPIYFISLKVSFMLQDRLIDCSGSIVTQRMEYKGHLKGSEIQ